MLYQGVWTDSKNIQATPFESSLKSAVSRGPSLGGIRWSKQPEMDGNLLNLTVKKNNNRRSQ